MSRRYRLVPTPTQQDVMRSHCADARFVWNLALEQANCYRPGRPTPNNAARMRQLTEARQGTWLGAGSSSVQQAALRDFDRALRDWWAGSHRRPTWRRRDIHNGFCVRDLKVRRLSRKWATVAIPKCGPVRLRLSRPIPLDAKSARVTLDRAGRWHVAFTAAPPPVPGPGTGEIVGVDRGIAVGYQCSDGRRWDAASLRVTERQRLRRLQRRLARQQKGSTRRQATKVSIARIKAREADRRRDTIEKATTALARTADVVRIEDLRVAQMMRSGSGTVDAPGTRVAQKRGLNRAIAETGWAMFARRLGDKIGDRLEVVPAAYTSQRCAACGHTCPENRESQAVFRCRACGHEANADVNAAINIAAGRAVIGRGGTRAIRRPREASTTPHPGIPAHWDREDVNPVLMAAAVALARHEETSG